MSSAGGGDVFGALKSFGVEAKRATERAKQSFYQRVGISESKAENPEFERMIATFMRQSANIRKIKDGAEAVLVQHSRMCSASHGLATTYYDVLMIGNPSESTTTLAEASMAGYV